MKKQISWVNGMKAVMCLIVALNHFESAFGYVPIIQKLQEKSILFRFITNGNIAMNIFLALTGFLAANTVFSNKQDDVKWLSEKIVGRYFRLALPLFVANFLTYLLQKVGLLKPSILLGYKVGEVTDYYAVSYSLKDVFYESFFRGMFNSGYSWSWAFWMIVYLLIGYYVALFAALTIKSMRNSRRFILLGTVLVFLGCLFSQYFVVIGGVFAYCFYDYFSEREEKKGHLIFETAGITAFIGAFVLSDFSWILADKAKASGMAEQWTAWWFYSWLASFVSIMAVCCSKWLQKFFSFRLFDWLSKVSFPIYLFHGVCYGSFGVLTMYACYKHGWEYDVGVKCTFAVCVLAVLALSIVYARWIDRLIKKVTALICGMVCK